MMGKRHPASIESMLSPGDSVDPADVKVTAMIHPSDSQAAPLAAVRHGQPAPVTCAACGCRMTQTGDAWFHFNPMNGRDARGCRVSCADAAHDASGRPESVAV